MPDRYNGVIRIGGAIGRTIPSIRDPETSALNEMIGMINGADVSHEWGDAVAVICEGDDDALFAYINDNGLLEFKGEEVRNGEFEELEEFLREQGIPYNRGTPAYGGYMGQDVFWLPGMDEPMMVLSDDHGTDYVTRNDVLIALGWLRTNKLEKAIATLEACCPEEPTIPPFKIVD